MKDSARCFFILKIFFIIIFMLTLRIFYLQLFKGPGLSHEAYSQRLENIKLTKPRGNILDRNNIPFTNRDKQVFVVIKPVCLDKEVEKLKKVCDLLNIDYSILKKDIKFTRKPIIFETDEKTGEYLSHLHIRGVSVLFSLKRYKDAVAAHVLGYLNKADGVGETGIEKFYEEILRYDTKRSVAIVTDAKNNPVHGLGLRKFTKNSIKKMLNVKLTLDYHIQKIISDIMEKYAVKGAVVIEEVISGNIIAMVSKPDFDPDNVDKFLESSNNELFNRAVASYSPGSVFKIIDTAQIFESDIYSGYYYCDGVLKLGNIDFKCYSYRNGGHGWLNLAEAFALSCNTYFIDMGIKIGCRNIIDMAAKFGFGKSTGIIEQGIDESFGNIPDKSRYLTDGDTANISIGQGEILVTPLQVADMVATIANGGIKNKINIVDSIVDNNGNKVRNLKYSEGKRIISRDTSEKLKYLMEHVVNYGTGKKAAIDEYGGAGGKTGSAETGQYINREKVIHAWFAGYFPGENPEYSMTVFVENGKSGGDVAAPIFAEIAEIIMKKGY